MSRLCVRPGCEEPGVVAFGIDPAARVFWLALPEEGVTDHELCARHSARLTVPRGWLLDDRREEHPRLFAMDREPQAWSMRDES